MQHLGSTCGTEEPHVLQVHLFHPNREDFYGESPPLWQEGGGGGGGDQALGRALHGGLVDDMKVAVGGAAVSVAGATPVLVGLGARGVLKCK